VITILTKENKRGRIVSLVDIACERESVSLVDIASHITVEGDTKRVIRHFYDISISLLKKILQKIDYDISISLKKR